MTASYSIISLIFWRGKIPRGSKRYNLIKKIRSASERANSTMKEDLKILEKPRILNAQRAAILAQMAAIVLLLRRAFKFVVKITFLFTKLHQINDPAIKDKLKPPSIAKSIQNLIQMEWAVRFASDFCS